MFYVTSILVCYFFISQYCQLMVLYIRNKSCLMNIHNSMNTWIFIKQQYQLKRLTQSMLLYINVSCCSWLICSCWYWLMSYHKYSNTHSTKHFACQELLLKVLVQKPLENDFFKTYTTGMVTFQTNTSSKVIKM